MPAQSVGTGPIGPIAFDIPAQPLDQALDAFGAVSGLQIFYESSLTTGRRSAALQGTFEPKEALRMLLDGSALTARVIAVGTISIAEARKTEGVEPKRQTDNAYLPYYGSLQLGVMKALCSRAETRPGNYHLALQYWIDGRGRGARLKLIGSSGSSERDAAIMDAVQGLNLQPPANMPQPVTIAIEPVQTAACPPANLGEARGR